MSKPKDMPELYHAAMEIIFEQRTAQRGIRDMVTDIVDLAVEHERDRIAQQIRNRLRVLEPGRDHGLRMTLESLLEYVESKDATVQMEE